MHLLRSLSLSLIAAAVCAGTAAAQERGVRRGDPAFSRPVVTRPAAERLDARTPLLGQRHERRAGQRAGTIGRIGRTGRIGPIGPIGRERLERAPEARQSGTSLGELRGQRLDLRQERLDARARMQQRRGQGATGGHGGARIRHGLEHGGAGGIERARERRDSRLERGV